MTHTHTHTHTRTGTQFLPATYHRSRNRTLLASFPLCASVITSFPSPFFGRNTDKRTRLYLFIFFIATMSAPRASEARSFVSRPKSSSPEIGVDVDYARYFRARRAEARAAFPRQGHGPRCRPPFDLTDDYTLFHFLCLLRVDTRSWYSLKLSIYLSNSCSFFLYIYLCISSKKKRKKNRDDFLRFWDSNLQALTGRIYLMLLVFSRCSARPAT